MGRPDYLDSTDFLRISEVAGRVRRLLGAIRGGFINSLVTHPYLARSLVAQQENQPRPDAPEEAT
jgi:hypothetical protein